MRKRVSEIAILAIVILAVAVAVAPAQAKKKNIPEFELEFKPQQAVAGAELVWDPVMSETPIQLRVVDKRPGDDPSVIGTRTDDDDRRGKLFATNDVREFVEDTLKGVAEEWGVAVKADAPLVLEGTLLGFKVNEENQAVGATFNATVRLSFKLLKGGEVVWEGSESGDATRYGKKFSNENCNEVLSDALLEAFAEALSSSGLHKAWGE